MYNNNLDFELSVQKIVAMAFELIQRLNEAFEVLCNKNPQELEPVFNQFKDYYLEKLNRRGERKVSLFAFELKRLQKNYEKRNKN